MQLQFLDGLRGTDVTDDTGCRCRPTFETWGSSGGVAAETVLCVDAADCDGDLATNADCRATVIGALAEADADLVCVRADGLDRFYDGRAGATLLAAGQFVDRVALHDADLARRARRDPVGVAREALGRAGPVARLVAESGLAACVEGEATERLLTPSVAPSISLGRTADRVPEDATLRTRTELDTGGSAVVYDREDTLPLYHLRPADGDLGAPALELLAAAYEALATSEVPVDDRAPARAVRVALADDDIEEHSGTATMAVSTAAVTAALRRHTRGLGVLDDLFADDRVTDASVSPPATRSTLRVVVDGETMTTNLTLSAADLTTLAARVRAASGRGFSRAVPTVDAALGGVRVAGVTAPASDCVAFAFRRRDDAPWTLPRLVSVGSLDPAVAGLLSVAVERGGAVLVAGPRGAGKTSLLGALCGELSPSCRTVVVEDTPELPLSALSASGRDVQGITVGTDADTALTPTEAVRAALRLGEGALVVGEVRGEEACALYEAMRVGAAADAVLGTIHGTGGEAVRERVVSDLSVPASSFASTDLIVTLDPDRMVASVEEVRGPTAADLVPLATRTDATATPTGRVDAGDSTFVGSIARPGETDTAVRDAIRTRVERLRALAESGRTGLAARSTPHATGPEP